MRRSLFVRRVTAFELCNLSAQHHERPQIARTGHLIILSQWGSNLCEPWLPPIFATVERPMKTDGARLKRRTGCLQKL
jgi:hypothetical protein